MSNHAGDKKSGDRPRIATVLIAGLASAMGFFVITKSGLAGSLAGAAMASMVYTGAAHGLGVLMDRGATRWLRRHGDATPADGAPSADVADPASGETQILEGSRVAGVRSEPTQPTPAFGSWIPAIASRRVLASWGPLVLGILAVGVSAYALVAGEPLERVIVRERVVDRPVVEERIVVQHDTVTVTVPAPDRSPSGSGGSSTPAVTTSTVAADTTTSTEPTTTTTPLPDTTEADGAGTTPASTTPSSTPATTDVPPVQ